MVVTILIKLKTKISKFHVDICIFKPASCGTGLGSQKVPTYKVVQLNTNYLAVA